ncbi:MAG: GTP-binding protein [Clostridiales bacterium]|nr:GTP-binding protein [Candidatus Blautia equi]
MAKIDIVSGFLGAGKTTLIKKLLKESFGGEQVVLIENEFGEIGIDGGFLKEAGIEIREMNSGCICCSLVGDFGTSLMEVVNTYHPDRILIEPSGVGKLSDVIKAVQDVQEKNPELVLNSYTTVVDAKKCKMYMRNFGEFFNNQVEHAGAIIMSRTDIVSAEKAEEAMQMLREINKNANIITTPIAQLDGVKLLEVMEHQVSLEKELMEEEVCPECGHVHHHHHHDHDEECCCGHDHDHEHEHHHHHHDHDEECCCGHDHDHEHEHHHHHHDHDGECCCGHDHEHGHHHHHHHADEVFTSWGRETIKKYTKEGIQSILDKLADSDEYGIILRAKGMLPAEDGTWIYFDMVPEESEVREGAPEFTGRLCVIGSEMKEDKLAELFGL